MHDFSSISFDYLFVISIPFIALVNPRGIRHVIAIFIFVFCRRLGSSMPEAASKIIKPDGKPVTDLERQISGALADLDSSSEIKNQLRELFIVGVKVLS